MNNSNSITLWKEALIKALFACLLFLVFDFFQAYGPIREKVENPAFDRISSTQRSIKQAVSNPTPVTVFTFDNQFMQREGLYDKENNPNYGYVLPRRYIVDFITALDERIKVKGTGCPKALFIDMDLNFPMAGRVSKENPLRKDDQALIDLLKDQDRCYKILLPKIGTYHFIEEYNDPQLQKLITKNKKVIPLDAKILFVSPFIHSNKDGEIRRYVPTSFIGQKQEKTKEKEKKKYQTYPSAAHALWYIINNRAIDIEQIKLDFPDYAETKRDRSKDPLIPNINGTNILYKSYIAEDGSGESDKDCTRCYSRWSSLKKFSLSYQLKDRDASFFSDGIILLGTTYQPNPSYHNGQGDYYNIPEFIGNSSMGGIDIHANTLMTLLYLNQDKPLQLVTWWKSLLIIFFSFFLIDWIVSALFKLIGKSNSKIELFVTLVLNTVVLYQISKYFFMQTPPLWFNWFIPLILIEIVEVMILLRKHLPFLFRKLRRPL